MLTIVMGDQTSCQDNARGDTSSYVHEYFISLGLRFNQIGKDADWALIVLIGSRLVTQHNIKPIPAYTN